MHATELEGDDRAAAWQTMLKTWPNYAKYEERTDRLIPVFRLARSPSDPAASLPTGERDQRCHRHTAPPRGHTLGDRVTGGGARGQLATPSRRCDREYNPRCSPYCTQFFYSRQPYSFKRPYTSFYLLNSYLT